MKTEAVHRRNYEQQNILLVTKPLFFGNLPVIAHLSFLAFKFVVTLLYLLY